MERSVLFGKDIRRTSIIERSKKPSNPPLKLHFLVNAVFCLTVAAFGLFAIPSAPSETDDW
jgi:hypothetical protein